MELAELRGVGPVLAEALKGAGVARVEDLAGLKPPDLVELTAGKVDEVRARLIVEAAAEAMGAGPAPTITTPAAVVFPDMPPDPPPPPPEPEVDHAVAIAMLSEPDGVLSDARCCYLCAAILVTGNPTIRQSRQTGEPLPEGTEITFAACTCDRTGTVGVNDPWAGRGFKEKVVANVENRRVFRKWFQSHRARSAA